MLVELLHEDGLGVSLKRVPRDCLNDEYSRGENNIRWPGLKPLMNFQIVDTLKKEILKEMDRMVLAY